MVGQKGEGDLGTIMGCSSLSVAAKRLNCSNVSIIPMDISFVHSGEVSCVINGIEEWRLRAVGLVREDRIV